MGGLNLSKALLRSKKTCTLAKEQSYCDLSDMHIEQRFSSRAAMSDPNCCGEKGEKGCASKYTVGLDQKQYFTWKKIDINFMLL